MNASARRIVHRTRDHTVVQELVDQVTNPSYAPGPKAWIEVTDADAKQTTSKVPRYDLPAPLKVSDEDQARITVDIKLLDRGGGE